MDYRQEKNRLEAIALWGHATSVALFHPSCLFFSIDGHEGFIGYRLKYRSAIVCGDPVCPPEKRELLLRAFASFCKQQKKTSIYVAVSPVFATWALKKSVAVAAISVGSELVLDPSLDPLVGSSHRARALRNKKNHALRVGSVVKEYKGNDLEKERVFDQLVQEWLRNRKGPQIFLSTIALFVGREHKRWFYVEHQEKIVAILMLNTITAYQGYFINMLMILPSAPYGTSELLVLHALTVLREEKCQYLSIGTVPVTAITDTQGVGPISLWIAKKFFLVARRFFNLQGRGKYWEKFLPRTESSYALFSKPRIGILEGLSLINALK